MNISKPQFRIKDLALVVVAIGGVLGFYERYDQGFRNGIHIGHSDGVREGESKGYEIAFQSGFEAGCSHTQDYWFRTDKDSYRRFFIEGPIGLMWKNYPIYHCDELGKSLEDIRELQKQRYIISEGKNISP